MKKQRNYDKRVKNTRILLSDWLVLKRMSQAAGISMAEVLHGLIEHQAQLPMLDIEEKPAFTIKAPVVAFQAIPRPVLTVNGHRAGVLVVNPKGGIIND